MLTTICQGRVATNLHFVKKKKKKKQTKPQYPKSTIKQSIPIFLLSSPFLLSYPLPGKKFDEGYNPFCFVHHLYT